MKRNNGTLRHLAYNSTFYATNERNTKDWFADQYEKLIGKPLPRKELTTDEVLKRLKDSAKNRRVNEAKRYQDPVPQTGTIHYLEWSDPQIQKCMCPDEDCICKGGVIFPRKKIPRGERYIKSPVGRKLRQWFRKPAPRPTQNFMQRLADVVGVEACVYKDLEKNGILSIRGAEFCTSRCIRYYGAGHFPITKHQPDNQKLLDQKMDMPSAGKDTDKEEKICDTFLCKASTQTNMGPDGEFIIGNFSHVLFATLDDTIVRDIEGTALRISSFKYVNNGSRNAAHHPCGLDQLLSLGDLINLRELKNHLSIFRRNIYSSIFEIKGTSTSNQKLNMTHEKSLKTQYEEEDVNKKSSENISIATPYKGVVIKVKKENLKRCTSEQNKKGVPQKPFDSSHHSCDMLPDILQSNCDRFETNLNKNSSKKYIKKNSAFKTMCDSLVSLERQHLSPNQNEEFSDKLITGLKYESLKTPSNQHVQDQNHTISDYNINNSANPIVINEENNRINISNASSSQLDFKYVEDSILSANCQKTESIKKSEQFKHQLNKNSAIKENGNIVEPRKVITINIPKDNNFISSVGVKRSKCNIINYLKRKLYSLSLEQLQKIKIFQKSLSNNENIKFEYDNKIGQNNKKMFSTNKSKEILMFNNGTKSGLNTYMKSKHNVLCDSTTSTRIYQSVPLFQNEKKSNPQKNVSLMPNFVAKDFFGIPSIDTLEMTSITENKTNYKHTHDLISSISIKVKSKLDEMKSHIQKESLDVHSELKTTAITYTEENQDKSALERLELQSNNVTKCNENSLQKSDQDNNENLADYSLPMYSTGKQGPKEGRTINKKPSVLSFHPRKLICKKTNNSIKSLPEQILYKSFLKSIKNQRHMSEIDRNRYIRMSVKSNIHEPKCSEKEVFSIQYNALLGKIQRPTP